MRNNTDKSNSFIWETVVLFWEFIINGVFPFLWWLVRLVFYLSLMALGILYFIYNPRGIVFWIVILVLYKWILKPAIKNTVREEMKNNEE